MLYNKTDRPEIIPISHLVMAKLNPKSVVESIYEAFNERNANALDKLLATDFVDFTAGPGQKRGAEGIKEVWAWIWMKHPTVTIRVSEILTEGDKVATRATFLVQEGDSESKIGWMIEMIRVSHGQAMALWNMIHWEATRD